MHPKAKISTGKLYPLDLRTHSGALYHLVDIYSVYGGALLISLTKPKSEIFTIYLESMSKLSGLRSL